jgi:hypothetical protein
MIHYDKISSFSIFAQKFKYLLTQPYALTLPIKPVSKIQYGHVLLEKTGVLVIQRGYLWDGPSGPSFDTENFMRGSLVHDALYLLMRENKLDISYRKTADQILHDICIEDGMCSLRATWVYWAVRLFGKSSATPREMPLTFRNP